MKNCASVYSVAVPVDELGRVYLTAEAGESASPSLPCWAEPLEPSTVADRMRALGLTPDGEPPVLLFEAGCAGPGFQLAVWVVEIGRPGTLPARILPPMLLSEAVKLIAAGAVNDLFSLAALLRLQQSGTVKERLAILYRDDYCVAVHKPAGMLVHRHSGDPDRETLLRTLRNQIGCRVQPLHRLDRPTSGLVLFALDADCTSAFHRLFQERQVGKTYLALVRGYTEPSGEIDHPIRNEEDGRLQEAFTAYRRLATVELPIPVGRYETARFSLVEAVIGTGRTHQIRRHFAHISHPVVGDTQHGDGRQNRLFREHFHCFRLMLAAVRLEFEHPVTGAAVTIASPPDFSFAAVIAALGLDLPSGA